MSTEEAQLSTEDGATLTEAEMSLIGRAMMTGDIDTLWIVVEQIATEHAYQAKSGVISRVKALFEWEHPNSLHPDAWADSCADVLIPVREAVLAAIEGEQTNRDGLRSPE